MKKHRKKKKVRFPLYLLMALGAGAMVLAACQLSGMQQEYQKSNDLYGLLRQQVIAAENTPAPYEAKSPQLPEKTLPQADTAEALPAEPVRQQGAASAALPGKAEAVDGENIKARATDAALPFRLSAMNFDPLMNINPQTVAWLRIAGIALDYPVVQGKDNDYYLDHLFNGSKGKAGSIFMDMYNAQDLSDQNTVIYGHHMKNDSMFAVLDRYGKQSFYEQHPNMQLFTPQGDYEVEWFAGYIVDPNRLPIHFDSEEAFMAYVTRAKERSQFQADVEIKPYDRIVTLCTCSYVRENVRYVLQGVMREK